MNNCGKCVNFGHLFHGFGKCYDGPRYEAAMKKKGRAETRIFLQPACPYFDDCRDVGLCPIELQDVIKLSRIRYQITGPARRLIKRGRRK